MPKVNENIEPFKCLIRASYFTKKEEDANTYHNAYAFGIQSINMNILTFHVMTDYGMLRSRVPLSEIYIKKPVDDLPYYYKQLWDCFSENVTVTQYGFLKNNRCQVILRDKTFVWATYLMTVDWYDNAYSNEPSDYKCGHILVADEGYLLCQPNNRIFWKDSNWITKEFPIDPKEIKVDTELLSVESVADRWVSEDTDSFYYDVNKK
jgi:hypothetical protein